MTTHKEALTLVLEALELTVSPSPSVAEIKAKAWRVGKEALAQPEQSGLNPLWIATHPDKLAQPAVSETHKQEPVAVVETIGGYPDESAHVAKWLVPYKSLKAGDKLYTTPPQRKPWVSLSEADIHKIWSSQTKTGDQITRDIEAKLKEKNT